MAVAYVGDGCLLWPFVKGFDGYGHVKIGGKMMPAHRRVLQLATGESGEGLDAAHLPGICHKPACVNPAHLRWATHAENCADKLTDGTHNRGERHSMAKLTETDVLAIRADSRTQTAIAAEYGVTQTTIWRVKHRKGWDWLPDA